MYKITNIDKANRGFRDSHSGRNVELKPGESVVVMRPLSYATSAFKIEEIEEIKEKKIKKEMVKNDSSSSTSR